MYAIELNMPIYNKHIVCFRTLKVVDTNHLIHFLQLVYVCTYIPSDAADADYACLSGN